MFTNIKNPLDFETNNLLLFKATVDKLLNNVGIQTEFESVPGKHFADAIPRLEKAFSALYSN
ncbi:MAG: hypothetical protein K2G74_06565 [Muribaculaceae bacterium]|nr:hypothetical protein [Muribaculaceae bacterium]